MRTRTLRRVVVSGLGFITSIGNDRASVTKSLRETRTGVEIFPEFAGPNIPIKLAGTVKEFSFPTPDPEDWIIPPAYRIARSELRAMSPNVVYGYCAMQQAIADAKLPPELVSNPRTGAMCASNGSVWLTYDNVHVMETKGVQRCAPMALVSGIPGTLNINLTACYHIKGATLGFASACASSSHALGRAYDLIQYGRQDTVFVVGAEDCNKHTFLPFAAVRALSTKTDPSVSPCAFDKKRDGFVPTGGAAVLVVESLDQALARGASIYAEILGWGESSDGYNVMAPEPTGEGLSRCMDLAMEDAEVKPSQIDYINAHATSTGAGDIAEIHAIQRTFAGGRVPYVSSTKSLTGHGLHLAGAMEAGFTCLALKEKFIPVSANITELDPACAGVPVVTKPVDAVPVIAMSNSSGFGGANVSVIFRAWDNNAAA